MPYFDQSMSSAMSADGVTVIPPALATSTDTFPAACSILSWLTWSGALVFVYLILMLGYFFSNRSIAGCICCCGLGADHSTSPSCFACFTSASIDFGRSALSARPPQPAMAAAPTSAVAAVRANRLRPVPLLRSCPIT